MLRRTVTEHRVTKASIFVTGLSISFSVQDIIENAGIMSMFFAVCCGRIMGREEGF